MVIEIYNILQTQSNSDIALEDYNAISKVPNKTFKIGIIGTVLLCSNPNIYANEVKYKLKDKVTIESVQCAKEYSSYFDSYVDSVNGINKINFSKREVITNILSFKSLKNNWDGYNAIPLEIESASNAIFLINELEEKNICKVDDFYPNTHGTITFEWVNESGEKLFVEVGNDKFSYFVKYNNLKPQFFNDLELNNENIKKLSTFIKSI
jgi:hypothetical protein